MRVVVDTSVWSLALRRKSNLDTPEVAALQALIGESLVVLIGPVRQEILSGIRHPEQFERLRDRLAAFPDLQLSREDFEMAAELCNQCMSKGVQAAHTDFLIAAVAMNRDYAVFSVDKDFRYIAQIVPVRVYSPADEA